MQGRHESAQSDPSAHDTDSPAMLKPGEQGEAVRQLQYRLSKIGYRDIDGSPHADGEFGDRTRRAIEAFQYDYGLVVDGIVGPKTWTALKHAEYRHRFFKSPTVAAEDAVDA